MTSSGTKPTNTLTEFLSHLHNPHKYSQEQTTLCKQNLQLD
jgi:hypothetical protein